VSDCTYESVDAAFKWPVRADRKNRDAKGKAAKRRAT
jgi:hypothetical protein